MHKLFIFAVCCFFFCIRTNAQHCLTDTLHSYRISHSALEQYSRKLAQARLETDTVFLPLQIHIVQSSAGLQADEVAIAQSIEVLNLRFRSLGIQFVACNAYHYIVSDAYSSLDDVAEANNLVNAHNSPKAIDVYYVNDVTYGNICGFATIGWTTDGHIVMKKGCENNGTLEHEMGHYFNLLHTHEIAYGAELVNGSNCTTAGDLLCDTPADPNLQWEVFSWDCTYHNTTLRDANNEIYKPLTDNIMSYSGCKKAFTPQQQARMRMYYDQVMANWYSCSNKIDFVASLSIATSDFKKGQDNAVRLIVQNASSVSYNGPLSYSIYLESPTGAKTILKTGTFTKNYLPLMKDTVSLILTVPGALEDNTYQLVTFIDSEGKIDESIENNNYHTQQVGLYSNGGALPDLIVTYTGATSHYAGEMFHVEYQYKNVGNAPLPSTFDNDVFVSEDDQLSLDDIRLGYYYAWQLGVNEVYVSSFEVGLPVSKPGYIIACADIKNDVEELSENNNCVVQKITNLAAPSNNPKPDFVVTGHEFHFGPLTSAKPLDMLYLKLTEANIGQGQADIEHLFNGFYLSKDQTLSSDDVYMGNGTGYNSVQFEIPLKTTPGAYYVIVKVDFRDYVAESNEDNNTYSFPLQVIANPVPDLILTKATLSDYYWPDNKNLTLQSTVKNEGTDVSDSYKLMVYVRKDSLRFKIPFLFWFDPLFTSLWETNTLAVGQQANNTFTFNIGKQFAPGKYFVAACVQNWNGTDDDRSNNCLVFDKPVIVGNSIITDLEETNATETSLSLFPNPSHSEVEIVGEKTKEIALISLEGRTLALKVSHNRFDVSGLVPGLYTVRISTASGSTYRKLMVE